MPWAFNVVELIGVGYVKGNLLDELCFWLGDSEASGWTAYSAELVAKVVLSTFSGPQWAALKDVVLSRSEYWQQRCVVSLGEDRSLNAIVLLKLLLEQSPYLDVRIMAIYELDWAEVEMEKKYAQCVRNVIAEIPADEIESELLSLLKKAESAGGKVRV